MANMSPKEHHTRIWWATAHIKLVSDGTHIHSHKNRTDRLHHLVRSTVCVRMPREEAQHARMMHEALTDDAKQEVKRVIEAEEASAGILRGTKSQRYCGTALKVAPRARGIVAL